MTKVKKSVFYDQLVALSDSDYQKFSCKLIPNVESQKILGVRIPDIRILAKKLIKEDRLQVDLFFSDVPHFFYEENNLHALCVSDLKDFDQTIKCLNAFLPYVDNWATCDILRPKIFQRKRSELLPFVRQWISSKQGYVVRFGIEMLMVHFLGQEFQIEHLQWLEAIDHQGYYVKMMIAWYLATALSCRYEQILPLIEEQRFDPWIHNMAIQKVRESRRIPQDRKEYLLTLKHKVRQQ